MMVRIQIIVYLTILFSACSGQDRLPIIHILSQEPINWDKKTPCQINYSHSDTDTLLSAAIKFRGGMSSAYDKHSFSFELTEKYSFKSLPHDDDWVLNASYIDKTFMRHKLCYDLFREMNHHHAAAKCSYVHVQMDNSYEGLYVLMEQINAGMLDLDKSDSMAMLFKEPAIFYEEKSYDGRDSLNYYNQKYPKISDKDVSFFIENFKSFLFSSTKSQFTKNIANWVDLENIMDWHLLLLFTNNSDGIMKNFYLYKLNEKTPFRIAIWDCDHSFGRDGDNERNMINELDCDRSILLNRLSGINSYQVALKKRWSQLRNTGVFTAEHIDELIKGNHSLIEDAVLRNKQRWPVDSKWYFDSNQYPEEVTLIKEFVKLRLAQLDEQFSYSKRD